MSVIKNDIFHLEENYFTAFYDLINKSSIVDIDVDCYSHKSLENFSRARLELMVRRLNTYFALAADMPILNGDASIIKIDEIRITPNSIDSKGKDSFKVNFDEYIGKNSLFHKYFSIIIDTEKGEYVTESLIIYHILDNIVKYTHDSYILVNLILDMISNTFNPVSIERQIEDKDLLYLSNKLYDDFKPIINPDEYDFKYLVWNDRYKFNLILQDALKVFLTILKFIEWEDRGDNRIERYNVDYQLPELNLYYLSYSNIYKIDIQNSYEYSFDIDAMLKYGDINNLFTYMILTVAYKPILHDALSESMALMDYMGHNISMYAVCTILEVMFGNCTGKPVEEEEEKTYMPVK